MKSVLIKKYEYIDALRGFAILGVVCFHSFQWMPPSTEIFAIIATQGTKGVQLFYLASALTLFLSMGSRKQLERRPLTSFFIRRFFRIAPLFYLAILGYISLNGMSANHYAPNGIQWWYLPLTALFMHGWHPETINSVVPGGWSIAVEMTFYLLVPYFFFKLNCIKNTVFFLIGFLVLSKILGSIATELLLPSYPIDQQYLIQSFVFTWFFSQLPIFILGVLLYHIIKKYPHPDKSTSMLLLLISLFLFTAFLQTYTLANLLPNHFLYGVALLTFALSLHFSPKNIFVNYLTIMIGKYSFSIYLSHFAVIIALKQLISNTFKHGDIEIWRYGDIRFIITFLLTLSLSTAVSYITYNLIEIPGINLGKKIIDKL